MLHCAIDCDGIVPCTFPSFISCTLAVEILKGQRSLVIKSLHAFFQLSLEYDLATIDTGLGADVYKQIRRPHDLFIMLDHHYRISYVTESLQD